MKKRTKRVIGGLAALAAVPALSIAATGMASADSKKCKYIGNSVHGYGCFISYGDKVKVGDTAMNGAGIIAYWKTDYGRSGTCGVSGIDNTRTCNYDMREGRKITIEVWEVDNGEKVYYIGSDSFEI